MKLKTVIQAHSAIGELINLDRQSKLVLHSSVRIRLSGALRKTRPVVEDYQEQYNELVTKHGTQVLDKAGAPVHGQWRVLETSEKYPAFKKGRDEALDTEVEVSFTPFLTAELFGDSDEPEKQNQIPVEVIEVFTEVGLFKE